MIFTSDDVIGELVCINSDGGWLNYKTSGKTGTVVGIRNERPKIMVLVDGQILPFHEVELDLIRVMAKKKKKKKNKKKGITLKNPFQQIAMNRSGAGKHKNKKEKRQKQKEDWKEEVNQS